MLPVLNANDPNRPHGEATMKHVEVEDKTLLTDALRFNFAVDCGKAIEPLVFELMSS